MRYRYDALSRLGAVIEPGDSDERPSETYDYLLASPLSRVVTKQRVLSGQDVLVEEHAFVDGLGRPSGTVSTAEGNQTVVADQLEYGPRGLVTKRFEPVFSQGYDLPLPASPHTLSHYDALDRETVSVLPDGSRSEQRYGPLEREHWDPEDLDPDSPHHGTPKLERSNALGLVEVVERLGPEHVVTRYRHDALGRVREVTDALGQSLRHELDGLGRSVLIEHPATGPMRFVYDDDGHLIERHDARGARVLADYDGAGRKTLERSLAPDGTEHERLIYHYDEPSPHLPGANFVPGHLSSVQDAAGEVHYRYDHRGRISETLRTLDGARIRRVGAAGWKRIVGLECEPLR